MNKVYLKENAKVKEFESLKVFEVPAFNKDFEVAFAEINGRHPKSGTSIHKNFEESYLVVEGNATITLDGKPQKIKQGDVILIKKNVNYFVEGNVKVYTIISPLFFQKFIDN